ncbi:MAG: Asp-tRNA(Asn)/Glu-tRNA(Gln) amidotransferase subunit GatC [Patescibacteria group bacterium]
MSDTLTSSDLAHIAKLVNLSIDADQYDLFSSQLTAILDFVSRLQEVPTKNIAPTAQVTGLTNVYRDDVVDQPRILTQKDALANAHETHNGFFVVPAVFE